MTDARFPERWLNDRRIMRLSAAEFRAYLLSLTWSVSNRTDGRLEATDLALVPGFDGGAVDALVAAGLWSAQPGGWKIVDFADTQTTAAQLKGLEQKRLMDRDRQARKRAHDHGDHTLCLTDSCPNAPVPKRDVGPDVTRDETRDTKDRTGQDRQEQALEEENSLERSSWSQEMDDAWKAYGPVPVGPMPVAKPAVGSDSYSVPGCSGEVTECHLPKSGRVCAAHAEAVAS